MFLRTMSYSVLSLEGAMGHSREATTRIWYLLCGSIRNKDPNTSCAEVEG